MFSSRARALTAKVLLVLALLLAITLAYLDALVSASFDQRRWETPATVFARPLELYPGLVLSPEALDYELELLGYRDSATLSGSGQKRRTGEVLAFHARSFAFADGRQPPARVELRFAGDRVSQVRVDERRAPLFRLEPLQIGGIYPRHQDRLLLRLAEVPDSLLEGLLAVEDRGFQQHHGISPTGILRAALANLRAGRLVQGGSTITQQLVKNYYLSRERSLLRKLIEALMALMLELHADKSEILEAYLNEVYLGQDGPRAIHGFGLAARHYFDAPLETLGLHQQALLIGMVKGPSLYNPLRNPDTALARRNLVLDVMREQSVISEAEHTVASAMPLDISQRPRVINTFPAYLNLVRRQLRRDYREQDLVASGLRVFTSFDPQLQRMAETAVTEVLSGLDREDKLQAAMVVTRYHNGEVVALIGGRKPRFAGFNRALDAIRPMGSLIKPVVYLTALEQPQRWTLASLLDDSPVSVDLGAGARWEPENFERESHGQVPLHTALTHSYNQATARLGMQLGTDRVRESLRRLGLERAQPDVPAMLLGAGGVAPVEVATLYQSIAAGGFALPLQTIREVVDAQGKLLKRSTLDYARVADPAAMHLLHYGLREVVREGTGRVVYRSLPADFDVAGKTGTTNDNRDAWFAGFSGDLLAVNWVGRDDNAPTGLTGATGAAPIWAHFMAAASRAGLAYRAPATIKHYWVDEASGKLSDERCAGARLLPFIEGSQPQAQAPCSDRGNGVFRWFREVFQ
ncbi:MAG: penicillin-binding protein 1B [Halieaceae bacterium]|jgi:penicillin-binding protein 1B|nr:penicillin-binding protein 1B [Halieaceae bacterium]